MSFFVGILTFLLVVNCGVLILLILVQLPKKDAGAGLAFGGGTADALFGAGSGNALTKITKWATVVFVALAIILGELEIKIAHGNSSEFGQNVEQQQQQLQAPTVQPPASSSQSQSAAPVAPSSTPALPLLSATNQPAPAKTSGK